MILHLRRPYFLLSQTVLITEKLFTSPGSRGKKLNIKREQKQYKQK